MTSYVTGLQCRECGKPYPKAPLSVCEYCFGPLEVNYDYAGAKTALSQAIHRATPAQHVALPRTATRGSGKRASADKWALRRTFASQEPGKAAGDS